MPQGFTQCGRPATGVCIYNDSREKRRERQEVGGRTRNCLSKQCPFQPSKRLRLAKLQHSSRANPSPAHLPCCEIIDLRTDPRLLNALVEGGVSEKSLRNGANHGLWVLAKTLPGASGSLALERMQKKVAAAATGGILSPPGKQNENSG